MNGQSTSVIDEFGEHLTVDRSQYPNAQRRQSTSSLHRFDCITNHIDDDLLDLITIREYHEDWLLEIVFNWNKLVVYVLLDEADCVLDEANRVVWCFYDGLPLE